MVARGKTHVPFSMFPRGACLGFLCLGVILASAFPAGAVILFPQDDPPTGLVTHGPDVIGRWSTNATAVAISPNTIITVRHQGGGVGTSVWFGGIQYQVVGEAASPGVDLRVCRIATMSGAAANLATYASLYTGTDEIDQVVTLGGYGMTRGAPLTATDGTVYGYQWTGSSNTTETWGRNTIDETGTQALSPYSSEVLIAHFDGPGSSSYVPYEASIASWDSGGGWFVQNGSTWQVMGLSAYLLNHVNQTLFLTPWGQHRPYPDTLEAIRVSSYASWITGAMQTVPSLRTPGDANLDGSIDDNDLGILLGNWNTAGGWAQGNFNGDAMIDDNDLGILLGNWTSGSAPSGFAVPEPVTPVLLAVGGVGLLLRRRPARA